MVVPATPRALVVVTAELVAQPVAIARLKDEFASYDVHQQLLERLNERAVELPTMRYHRVHIASGDLNGPVSDALFASMTDGAELTGNVAGSRLHLTIAGFVQEGDRWVKKQLGSAPVQLKRRTNGGSAAVSHRRFAKLNDSQSSDQAGPPTPPCDDDIVDEDELVEGFDIRPAIVFPEKCDPGPGKKRRRACKDCTCGLKEQEEQEDADVERSRAVLLDREDMAEIDFTVPGKAVGGCGSCALGDAFRCDGCPYIGLPPFKPGQVVSLDQFGDDF